MTTLAHDYPELIRASRHDDICYRMAELLDQSNCLLLLTLTGRGDQIPLMMLMRLHARIEIALEDFRK